MKPLTFSQAVRKAIESERAASLFYRQLSESTPIAEAAILLDELADQEDRHARLIEEYWIPQLTTALPVQDHPIEGRKTAPSWGVADGLSLEQALIAAFENERRTVLFYDSIALHCSDSADFFAGLARAEEEQQRTVDMLGTRLFGSNQLN